MLHTNKNYIARNLKSDWHKTQPQFQTTNKAWCIVGESQKHKLKVV